MISELEFIDKLVWLSPSLHEKREEVKNQAGSRITFYFDGVFLNVAKSDSLAGSQRVSFSATAVIASSISPQCS